MAGLAATLVLALAGCMKMDINLDLQSDDTVDGHMTVGVSHALVELSGEDPDTLVEQMQSDLLDGELGETRTEAFSDDDFVGSTTHFEGAALATFDTGEEDALSIVRDGDDFVVSGTMDLSGEESEQLGALTDSFDIRIAVTFPGDVAEHTGELEGRTVVWAPKIGERVEISARGAAVEDAGGGLPTMALVAIGLGGLAVLALVVILLVRRNRGDGPSSTYAAEGFGPTADPTGEPIVAPPVVGPGPAAGSLAHGVPPVAPPPLDATGDAAPTASTPPAPAPPSVIPPADPQPGTPAPDAPGSPADAPEGPSDEAGPPPPPR